MFLKENKENLGDIIMLKIVEMYFWIFFIYSFLGWFMESVGGIINVKKFVNRGFLIGPYCPVYGTGVVLLSILLNKYKSDIIVLFFLSMLVCGTLEYLTSYIMEKFFNARWWDYSKKKFNINGRICLETTIPFGLAGCFILRLGNPFFVEKINMIPDNILTIITSIIAFVMFIDFIVSFVIISNFKTETKEVKDNTEEISKKVREATNEISDKIEYNTKRLVRVIKLNNKKIQHNVKFYSKKQLKRFSPEEVRASLNSRREKIQNSINMNKILLQQKIAKIKEENLALIKENFKKKSKLHERLIKAFPNFEINKKD